MSRERIETHLTEILYQLLPDLYPLHVVILIKIFWVEINYWFHR